MDFFYLVILGLVQGLTEFLPVSSSGHLVLLSRWFGISDSLFISIVLHVATLLSIIAVLRKDVVEILKNPLGQKSILLACATIPTCIIVIILMPLISSSFEGAFLPIAFLISALLLFITQRKTQTQFLVKQLDCKGAIVMGIAQGFAVFPGITRSGTTVCAGLLNKREKSQTAKFSFLMSVPIVFLSMCLEIFKLISSGEGIDVNILGLTAAFVVAFIVGAVSIKVMINLTSKANFNIFSLYLVVLSIISFIF